MPAFLYVYVEDVDAIYRRALEAGATSVAAPGETPYGDRRAMVRDAWGNAWQIATHHGRWLTGDVVERSPLRKLHPTRPPLRWLLRFPELLYRAKLGALLGERFVQLTIRGRRTGLPRRVVLEVIGGSSRVGEWLVTSAWGRRAQWFRNVLADPRVQVQVGRRRFAGRVAVLAEPAAAEVLREYARDHRWAYGLFIGPLLLGRRPTGAPEELAALARTLPVLAIRPAA